MESATRSIRAWQAKVVRFRVGIDIGGTFSDLVVLAADGRVDLKVSSAPDRLIAGLLDGLQMLPQKPGLEAGDADAIVHGKALLKQRPIRAFISPRDAADRSAP